MNKNRIVMDYYEQWGEGSEGLAMAISNVRMDDINAVGHLNKLLKNAEEYAYDGNVSYVEDLLYDAHAEAMLTSDQEWIEALLNLTEQV